MITAGTGADQRAVDYASIQVGDRLPEFVIGPITEVDVMRWCVAVENYHRIHYDAAFAVEHEGLEGVVVNGPFKQAMLARVLTGWLAPDARVRRITCRHRLPTYVGEVLTGTGEVLSKTIVDESTGRVDVALQLTNGSGEDVCPGSATVIFPLNSSKGQQ